jgi:hypothetical protein
VFPFMDWFNKFEYRVSVVVHYRVFRIVLMAFV